MTYTVSSESVKLYYTTLLLPIGDPQCKNYSLHLSFRPVGPGVCLLSLTGVVYCTGIG